ncbi:hypothetical protein CQW29_04695 [Pantoea coffeiphila]|uniref:Uncharacterized protein n=1 Tax=Pantoea coffeiphila TaxID=1465635 RepID=A0A2S9IGP6_9GAMM|nr:hypothetical protein CQW29_04695 [Pantoea coffeiphila]
MRVFRGSDRGNNRSLVRWFAGSLVRWFAGSLVRWFAGSLVHWFTGSLVHWFAGGSGIALTGGSRGRAVLAPRCGAFTSCVSLSDRHRRAVLARL